MHVVRPLTRPAMLQTCRPDGRCPADGYPLETAVFGRQLVKLAAGFRRQTSRRYAWRSRAVGGSIRRARRPPRRPCQASSLARTQDRMATRRHGRFKSVCRDLGYVLRWPVPTGTAHAGTGHGDRLAAALRQVQYAGWSSWPTATARCAVAPGQHVTRFVRLTPGAAVPAAHRAGVGWCCARPRVAWRLLRVPWTTGAPAPEHTNAG